jgi:hypothetical protein
MLYYSRVRGIFTEENAAKEADVDFCRCPFCACCFVSIQDLETHMATFGSNKEAHSENFRRTHGKVEYGWTNFP